MYHFSSRFANTLVVTLVCIGIFSCGGEEEEKSESVTTEKSTSPADSIIPEDDEMLSEAIPSVNDSLTDIARFIAGLQPEKLVTMKKLMKDSAWKEYAGKVSGMWKRFERDRLVYMDTFASDELNKAKRKHYNVLYPFSGPDLLHAVTFFPQADTVVMIALEPPGSLNVLNDKNFKDSMPQYFASMAQSLHAILNWSFFITKKMFKDLRQEELNGAVHLLMWFAARRGYEISSLQPASISLQGDLRACKSEADTAWKNRKTHGLCLTLVKGNHATRIFYYSADLSDYGIHKNKELTALLDNYQFESSFVKSASYLLHSSNFSKVRNLLLSRSSEHLQDDSGIPYSYFAADGNWKMKLFGSYLGPIKIFNDKNQPDLIKAYDSLSVSKLKFGIGYKHRKEESTLMLSTRKPVSKKAE